MPLVMGLIDVDMGSGKFNSRGNKTRIGQGVKEKELSCTDCRGLEMVIPFPRRDLSFVEIRNWMR
jgi:hypothetical protein